MAKPRPVPGTGPGAAVRPGAGRLAARAWKGAFGDLPEDWRCPGCRIAAPVQKIGGDPDGTGMGGPGYCIKGEFSGNGFDNPLKHDPGVLSMARAMDPDSAGSQFFIMHKKAPHLDGQYAGFGKVVEGFETVEAIANARTDLRDRPIAPQRIRSMTVETFGVEYPEPEKEGR